MSSSILSKAAVTTERSRIEIRGIPVEIVRKEIRNLHLAVYPPKGRVRVAVPRHLTDEAVRLAVITRLGWIRRKQREYAQQSRQSSREYLSGESHYVQGKRYRLRVVEHDGPPSVAIRNRSILELRVRKGTGLEKCEAVLQQWYRQRLRKRIPALIAKWEPKVGVEVADWGIKRMKTRWGTCNAAAGRIWLNLELAKKPLPCLEYIVVHEMVHLLERRHNDRFRELMDKLMPRWRAYRDELNRAPLAHEDWEY
jgi:predicted metal-dependent hydrolase